MRVRGRRVGDRHRHRQTQTEISVQEQKRKDREKKKRLTENCGSTFGHVIGSTDPLVQRALVTSTEEYCLMAGNNGTNSQVTLEEIITA